MAEVTDASKGKCRGLAYDVIIKPATSDNPPQLHHGSPPKDHPLSQEDIDRKLKEAEERRLSAEASKLQSVNKEKERHQEAKQKAHELEEEFTREAAKNLAEKMEASEEKRRAQELAKQERLKEHERHAEEVRKKKQSLSEDGNSEAT